MNETEKRIVAELRVELANCPATRTGFAEAAYLRERIALWGHGSHRSNPLTLPCPRWLGFPQQEAGVPARHAEYLERR